MGTLSNDRLRGAAYVVWLTLLAVLACLSGVLLIPRWVNSRASINDLSVPAGPILKMSWSTAKVDSPLAVSEPTCRIVHINDYHSLPRPRFAKAVQIVCPDLLSKEEFHDWHQSHADQVELLQASQAKLLLWLVDYHGVREVFQEGISEENVPELMGRVDLLRKIAPERQRLDRERLALSQQISEAEAAGRDSSALRKRRDELVTIRDYVLNCGAIGELLIERPAVRILPAEDTQAYEQARAGLYDPSYRLGDRRFQARDAAIVHNLLSHGPCAIIVLGAAHDLSDEVKKQSHGRCEYIRVTTTNYPPPFENGIPARVVPALKARRTAEKLHELIETGLGVPN